MILSFAGCTAVKKYEVSEKDLAYSRVLYDDSDFLTDEEEPEEQEIVEEVVEVKEKTSHEKEETSSKESEKTESKKPESKKVESKSSSTYETKKASDSVSTKKQISSKVTVPLKQNNSSSTSSKSTDTSTDTATDTEPLQTKLSVSDLNYVNGESYIFFGESEENIVTAKGEPSNSIVSDDTLFKCLTYPDCIMTLFRRDTESEYILCDIIVPSNSSYRTFKNIGINDSMEDLINTYGKPKSTETKIVKNIEKYLHPSSPIVDDSDSDTDEPSDTEISSDTSENSPDTPAVTELPEECTIVLCYYKLGNKSLIFTLKDDSIIQMEYKWKI